MRWGLKLLLYINLFLILLTLFAYLSPYINPKLTWFFSFFGLGFPLLLILNIVFIIVWLTIKPHYALCSIICLLLGYKAIGRTVGTKMPEESISGLSVMSYNIGHAREILDSKDPNGALEFTQFINEMQSDVVCLQERTKRHLPLYTSIFQEYELYPEEFIGTCIYSKLPILNKGNIRFDTKAHNATWIEVEYKGQRIRIYSLHLSSNKIRNMGEKENLREYWDESIFILDKYNLHAVRRSEQMQQVLDHAALSPYPVILTGDFNDVPQSYLYRMVSEHYNDAFIEHGFGFQKTHNTTIPILRIDYTFYSPELLVNGQKVIRENFSDHYPIVTGFESQ